MSEPNTSAYRCSACDIDWAVLTAHKVCPCCGQETWLAVKRTPLSYTEAQEIKDRVAKYKAFDAYLAARAKAFLDDEGAVNTALDDWLTEALPAE